MKKIFCILIICFCFILSGCDKQKPAIIMSAKPITVESAANPEQRFNIGQRINYAVVSPKGFKDSVLRIQVVKKEPLAPIGGFQIAYTKTTPIDINKKYYINYFTISASGYYIMRVFEVRDLENQIAMYDFYVQ